MKTTNQNDKQTATSGFAIELTESTPLGLAILIAGDEEGRYAPVAAVASEAREIAESYLRGRMCRLERTILAFAPTCTKSGANGIDGDYRIAITLPASSLSARNRR